MCVCIHAQVCEHVITHLWSSEDNFQRDSFLLSCLFWDQTCQAWHQVILHTMPSGLTKRYVLRNRKKYLLYHTNIRVCACVHAHLYCRIICFTIFLFWERVFIALAVLGTHCRTGWSFQSAENCPFLSLECWDWRGTLPHLACFTFLFCFFCLFW